MNPEFLRERVAMIAPNEDGCWLWPHGRDRDGYGRYSSRTAHRAVYELLRAPIPAGYEIDHLCRVRACVNPDHLEAVTRAENVRRQVEARSTCVHGHECTPDNTLLSAGTRVCRACNRRRAAMVRASRKEAA